MIESSATRLVACHKELEESLVFWLRHSVELSKFSSEDRVPYRAKRNGIHYTSSLRQGRMNQGATYVSPTVCRDTWHNRFVKSMILSARAHLWELKERLEKSEIFAEASISMALTDVLSKIDGTLERPSIRRLRPRGVWDRPKEELPFSCVKVCGAYGEWVSLISILLVELEREAEPLEWSPKNVLVGSLGSEEQLAQNLSKKFYYVPEGNLDPTVPIEYVALYQSKQCREQGIQYYGKVVKTKRLQRKRIRVPLRRGNGEEWYVLFRVKRWEKLPLPIEIKDDGVFSPRYTNLFLLKHCTQSYELFHLHSPEEYKRWMRLERLLHYAEDRVFCEGRFKFSETTELWIRGASLELLDREGKSLLRADVKNLMEHPKNWIKEFLSATK